MDEINQEYASSPDVFLNKVERTLSQENPLLKEILEAETISPIFDYSRKWTLTYYEMFSRTGRKAGLPLTCFVDGKLSEKNAAIEIMKITNSMTSPSKMMRVIEKYYSKIKQARLRDEEISDELGKFWKSVDGDTEKLRNEGYAEFEIEGAKACLTTFQEILQENDSRYRLSVHYKDVDPLKGRV